MTTFKKISLLCAAQSVLWPGAEFVGVGNVSTMTWVVSSLSALLALEFWLVDDDE